MSIKGLIFDLDGTLLDSMDAWDNIGEEYLTLKGIKNIPQKLKEALRPMSLKQAAEYFISDCGIQLSPQQIMEAVNLMIEDHYKYKLELKKGVREFLEKYSHLKMCIATATDRHLVEYALKRLDIDRYFSFIITSTEAGTSKQSPEIFIKAAEKLGLSVDEVIVFEDALHAIKTAKLAGFYTVGVREDLFMDDRDKIIEISDCYVENLKEFEVK